MILPAIGALFTWTSKTLRENVHALAAGLEHLGLLDLHDVGNHAIGGGDDDVVAGGRDAMQIAEEIETEEKGKEGDEDQPVPARREADDAEHGDCGKDPPAFVESLKSHERGAR